MINVKVKDITYNLSEEQRIGFGGEADIYRLTKSKGLKYFNQDKLNDKNKVNKVLTFCDKSDSIQAMLGNMRIAIPEDPAFTTGSESIFCGFSMELFTNVEELSKLGYSLGTTEYFTKEMNNHKATGAIEELFNWLQVLHTEKIILGDINPQNILINKQSGKTYLVDIDSAQIGEFKSKALKEEYCSHEVINLGPSPNKEWLYSKRSDIFSLSVVCFEFIIGVHPFEVGTLPIVSLHVKKEKGLNFMAYHVANSSTINSFKLVDQDTRDAVFKRLDEIKRKYLPLYTFFRQMFVDKKHNYYDPKNFQIKLTKHSPSIRRRIIPPIGVQNQRDKDPEELGLFLKNYGIKLPCL